MTAEGVDEADLLATLLAPAAEVFGVAGLDVAAGLLVVMVEAGRVEPVVGRDAVVPVVGLQKRKKKSEICK